MNIRSHPVFALRLFRNSLTFFLLSFSVVHVNSNDDTITSKAASSPLEPFYIRVHQVLEGGTIFKPRDMDNPEIPAELRPLLLVEKTPPASPDASTVEWGVWDPQQKGSVAPGPLTLYFSRSEIVIKERQHLQHSYKWFYRLSNGADQKGPWITQGLRIVFRESGSPEIWEVLQDSSGADLVFVSTRLEAAVRRQFGTPLPGRRFSIESSLETSPATLVPRVISDGPIPMGPWVYLIAGSLDVSTILCRCMPSQVTGDVDTAYYELAEEPSSYTESSRDSGEASALSQKELWEWSKSENWLEHVLRLPTDF